MQVEGTQMADITGKTIWVVGASSGIGYALAEYLAERGNFLILTARSIGALQSLKQRFSTKVAIVHGDITDPCDRERIHQNLKGTTDTLDYLVLSAGTCEYDDGPKLDMDMYQRVFDVNFFGNMACLKMALPMLTRASGSVVGIGSLASVVPFPRAEAYGASKAAFDYFLQSLSVDLKPSGVSVTLVRPGFVDTPLTQKNDFDMPTLVSASYAAEQIAKGMSSRKSVISFPWRLSVVLNTFSVFKSFWMNQIAPRLLKQSQL